MLQNRNLSLNRKTLDSLATSAEISLKEANLSPCITYTQLTRHLCIWLCKTEALLKLCCCCCRSSDPSSKRQQSERCFSHHGAVTLWRTQPSALESMNQYWKIKELHSLSTNKQILAAGF